MDFGSVWTVNDSELGKQKDMLQMEGGYARHWPDAGMADALSSLVLYISVYSIAIIVIFVFSLFPYGSEFYLYF